MGSLSKLGFMASIFSLFLQPSNGSYNESVLKDGNKVSVSNVSNRGGLEKKFNDPDSLHSTLVWKKIDTGLYSGEITPLLKSDFGDSKINVLKIDPELYSFDLISAKEKKIANKTADKWAELDGLLAAINAGMYQSDYKTNVGFMKDYEFFNNPRMNKDNTVVAFNRKDDSVPEFQIIDLQTQDWDVLKDKYNSFTQGIRMIDSNQKNRWSQQDKKWSIASIGMNKKGDALFLFSRSPYSVHDFNNILLNSGLDIYNAMYLEGGPEASFYLNHQGSEIKKFGSYETGFNENDSNSSYWKIPNIIGISKKD
jgi:uncharacterized protein YigE (DUF2233 family)